VPGDGPPGEPLAELVIGGRRLYTAIASPESYVVRFHGACDAVISADLTDVECRADPNFDLDLVPVLLVGTIAAFLLALGGRYVLHGSAVEAAAGALAIVGPSGVGKSTVAALCCAAGARLLSDDVLPLDLIDPPVLVGGWPELRLRPGASSVVDLYPIRPATRATPDGRLAVRSREDVPDRARVAAVVVPRPSRSAPEVVVARVRPLDAVFLLLASDRIEHWLHPGQQRRSFEAAAQLARAVPVFTADIPWGPPFDPAVGQALLARLVGEVV
jgi:hypothetical protein